MSAQSHVREVSSRAATVMFDLDEANSKGPHSRICDVQTRPRAALGLALPMLQLDSDVPSGPQMSGFGRVGRVALAFAKWSRSQPPQRGPLSRKA